MDKASTSCATRSACARVLVGPAQPHQPFTQHRQCQFAGRSRFRPGIGNLAFTDESVAITQCGLQRAFENQGVELPAFGQIPGYAPDKPCRQAR